MKNWFKTFETPEMDILVTKRLDDDDGKPSLKAEINWEDGIFLSQELIFESLEEREEAFEKIDSKGALRLMKSSMAFLQKVEKP